MNAMRILIADDQAQVRSALRLLLEQQPGVEVVGEAADATGLLRVVETKPADALLLDWELPGLAPPHLLRLLRYERPLLHIIAMSSRPEARRAAIDSGTDAFISKSDAPEMVLAALDKLRNGRFT